MAVGVGCGDLTLCQIERLDELFKLVAEQFIQRFADGIDTPGYGPVFFTCVIKADAVVALAVQKAGNFVFLVGNCKTKPNAAARFTPADDPGDVVVTN
ncbi:MAG TPA: hypothetical protein DDW55_02010 [Gammaproteobacteria bacterium]|nr:hypothetical protein [Gammaproteobacteria bacterium]